MKLFDEDPSGGGEALSAEGSTNDYLRRLRFERRTCCAAATVLFFSAIFTLVLIFSRLTSMLLPRCFRRSLDRSW